METLLEVQVPNYLPLSEITYRDLNLLFEVEDFRANIYWEALEAACQTKGAWYITCEGDSAIWVSFRHKEGRLLEIDLDWSLEKIATEVYYL
ncbi:hypothetical protein [Tellurirhabdus bombi]|uniref:hypothetical protein n=1 Tax=Tellurirhabdus bombi TaxID=2907205 RepID=UPI001F2C530C|nr:hypothetical protein [Tellurirhabdus bombi]